MRMRVDPAILRSTLAGPLGVRIRALLALCMVLGLGAVGTLALWSNSATATSGEFTTGIVDLRVNTVKAYVFTGATAFTMTGMIPGESRSAKLTLQNTLSTLPLTYTVSASTPVGSQALANHLQLAVFAGSTASNGTSNGLLTGSCSGSQLGSAPLLSGGSVPVVTSPQSLGAGAGSAQLPSTQDLCIVVTLTSTAPMSVQSQSVSAITLTFTATTT